jgi:protein-tyrosine phosphatase
VSGASLVPGVLNFRDTGGLPASGGVTRHGVLFRSGNLAAVAEPGRAALGSLGLRRVVDLRADDEVERSPSLGTETAETVRVPLFHGSVGSFFAQDMDLDAMYGQMIDASAVRVVDVVRAVIADQPVLVHCTVGKDRTGVTVALTLLAAGVEQDAVVADYARTETLLPERRNREVVERIRAVHPEAVNIEQLATRSPAPVMRRLLERLSGQYGSPVGFLEAHGLADDEIIELRRVLVAPA